MKDWYRVELDPKLRLFRDLPAPKIEDKIKSSDFIFLKHVENVMLLGQT